MRAKDSKDNGTPGSVFKVGAIALAFLVIGYQSALFLHRAATLRIESLRDTPDTVYVVDETLAARLLTESGYSADEGRGEVRGDLRGSDSDLRGTNRSHPADSPRGWVHSRPNSTPPPQANERVAPGNAPSKGRSIVIRRNAPHSEKVQQVRRASRKVENFRFNPNAVSVEDLIRLGFTEKQAQSIDNYRAAGGRFRRPSDFARSYVVADTVFQRLEPYITIPKLDINKADSAAFDDLPGIGPYFAAKMVNYRQRLGGYSYKEQLMDIYNFDREKYNGLSDLITCSKPAKPFRLWTLGADSLRLHPYIKDWQTARSIVLFRENTPPEGRTVEALAANAILTEEAARRLSRCYIE